MLASVELLPLCIDCTPGLLPDSNCSDSSVQYHMWNFYSPSINNKKHAYFIFPFNLLGNQDGGHRDFGNNMHILAATPSMNSIRAFTAFGTAEINIIVRLFDRIFSYKV